MVAFGPIFQAARVLETSRPCPHRHTTMIAYAAPYEATRSSSVTVIGCGCGGMPKAYSDRYGIQQVQVGTTV